MRGGGPVRAVPAHPAVPLTTVPPTTAASDYPAEPYPGVRPGFSFVQDEHDRVHRLTDKTPWTSPDRQPVLAYGSNACPAKIAWLRSERGLTGDVVVLRARCTGFAAVWAAEFRVVDDQRPATLAAFDGADDTHAVWLATAEQLAVLDVCEGRGTRYDLARLRSGSVHLEDGTPVPEPLSYVGAGDRRMPLLVDGALVRCADVPQAEAVRLVGVPADSDGLDRVVVPSLG